MTAKRVSDEAASQVEEARPAEQPAPARAVSLALPLALFLSNHHHHPLSVLDNRSNTLTSDYLLSHSALSLLSPAEGHRSTPSATSLSFPSLLLPYPPHVTGPPFSPTGTMLHLPSRSSAIIAAPPSSTGRVPSSPESSPPNSPHSTNPTSPSLSLAALPIGGHYHHGHGGVGGGLPRASPRAPQTEGTRRGPRERARKIEEMSYDVSMHERQRA